MAAPVKKSEDDILTSAEEEQTIQQWKVKKLIQRLENARGNGTSMISLVIPPKDAVARYSKMLGTPSPFPPLLCPGFARLLIVGRGAPVALVLAN